jgi:hypothetical protein
MEAADEAPAAAKAGAATVVSERRQDRQKVPAAHRCKAIATPHALGCVLATIRARYQKVSHAEIHRDD